MWESTRDLLPAGFLHPWDKTGRSHLAELDTADAKLSHITLGTSRDLAAVVQTHGRRVARECL